MKYKFFFLVFFLTTLLSSQSFAQKDSLFDDDDKQWYHNYSRIKIGGAGGFTPYYLFLNTKDLNSFLALGNAGKLTENGLVMYGGEGYGYIMFLKNVRVGGLGASGKMSSSSLDIANNIKREVNLDVSFSGFTMGYAIPLAKRFDAAIDVMLGGGEMNLAISRSKNSFWQWDSIWNHYGNPAYNESEYTQRMKGDFFSYRVSLNLEYGILDWLGIRFGAGYVAMVSPQWKLDEKFELNNVPSSISGKGVTLNLGVFAGAFGN